jgi:hypothetical protein
MQTKFPELKLTRIRLYAIVAMVVIVVWAVQEYAYNKFYGVSGVIYSSSPASLSTLSDGQRMAVTAETDRIAQLTNLATALLAGVGWLLVNARKDIKSSNVFAAFLAALCAGVSIYFGSAREGNLLFMLSNQSFDTNDPMYRTLQFVQFAALLLGAFFFADFAFLDLIGGSQHARHT